MNPEINKLINEFADNHTHFQVWCYQTASLANELGYPGASKWFLVQAQDEVLHTRKIYNYLLGRDEKITPKVAIPSHYSSYHATSLLKIFEDYKKIKLEFIEHTNNLIKAARDVDDFLTIKFLDWFLIDFYEEADQAKDYIDMIKMSNNDLYSFDKRLSKRIEPDTLKVIVPY